MFDNPIGSWILFELLPETAFFLPPKWSQTQCSCGAEYRSYVLRFSFFHCQIQAFNEFKTSLR